ncbi:hypothetical protein NECAME_16655 [Necator americanus]|uniref:Uncharacterized protein n=1 Tax=Necator americanus TaxID=51031 RepID=W2TVW0_NECAM|nr:hypothetical protein NECAME_16655 [Necator americanus]ETN85774.1 hypothetical protein NECAME_16655 [Necator americanus]
MSNQPTGGVVKDEELILDHNDCCSDSGVPKQSPQSLLLALISSRWPSPAQKATVYPKKGVTEV